MTTDETADMVRLAKLIANGGSEDAEQHGKELALLILKFMGESA
jgi:hypothetical protein